jgi:thiol-disulfide isomerase/thioredoxin
LQSCKKKQKRDSNEPDFIISADGQLIPFNNNSMNNMNRLQHMKMMNTQVQCNKPGYSYSGGNTGGTGFVYIFYADWCGHCKRSMPDFKELEKMFPSKVKLLNSEDPENENLKNKFRVRGFPTIVASSGVEFNEERSLDNLINFVKQNT